MTREQAVRKARSLMRLAERGGTVAETAAAAAAAERLLLEWDLTAAALGDDQPERDEACEPLKDFSGVPGGELGVTGRRDRW